MSKRKAFFCFVLVMCILLLLCILCIFYSYYARLPKFFSTRQITVGNGETLWHIAKREYPNSNLQEVIHYIREINDIKDPGKLQPGQVLELPVFEEVRCAEVIKDGKNKGK